MTRKASLWTTILLALTLCLTGAVAASARSAEVDIDASVITWQPLGKQALSLRISGGGRVIEMVGKPGEALALRLFDDDGNRLSDGSYTWELAPIGEARAVRVRDEIRGLDPSDKAAKGLGMSGYFTVADGEFVRAAKEPMTPKTASAEKDQVILDDLIVDGSICVGFDCVNGESFGFDTLRLKENNLRIHFQDTSTSASFPSTDWRITINDSSNGGANYFGIDDVIAGRSPFRIEANAPSHSLYVDDGGRIGFGTSTPVADLHVKSGNTPTLRLEQDGSSGFTPQTWDVAGNEANFFIRDATNGSTLPFRIAPGADTNSISIAANNNVGIGVQTADEALHVQRSDGGVSTLLQLENNGGSRIRFENNTVDTQDWLLVTNALGFSITEDGSGVTEFTLEQASGDLTIAGGLVTGTAGSCTSGTPCDGVFHPDFEVESIEEHAEYMWTNSHLRGVGPTPADAPINITRKTTGILNELEKAHIYIEQLHKAIKRLEQRLEKVEATE